MQHFVFLKNFDVDYLQVMGFEMMGEVFVFYSGQGRILGA
jgi:hypothetical protein